MITMVLTRMHMVTTEADMAVATFMSIKAVDDQQANISLYDDFLFSDICWRKVCNICLLLCQLDKRFYR